MYYTRQYTVDFYCNEDRFAIVNERAPDEIAKAVERLVKEPILADRLRTFGYKLAETKFYRSSTAIAFSQLFEKVIQMEKQT